MPNILFVCTANRCRSPMAAALFQELLPATVSNSWHVSSAGTWAADGLPAMPKAVTVMMEMGLNIRDHRSRSVDHSRLAAQDLILVMESNHLEGLKAEFPHIASRIRLLSEMAGPPFDIQDPVSEPIDSYRSTAQLLRSLLRDGLPKIQTLIAP